MEMIGISRRKAIIFTVLILIIIIPLGLYIAGNIYYSSARIYEMIWDIELPRNMKKIYEAESDRGFLNDGISYTVFYVKDKNELIDSFSDESNYGLERSFEENASKLEIPTDRMPDWNHKLVYKILRKNGDALYLVFDSETNYLFVLEILF